LQRRGRRPVPQLTAWRSQPAGFIPFTTV
jgi:hypothetical protein